MKKLLWMMGLLTGILLSFTFPVNAKTPELTDIRVRFCNDKALTGWAKKLLLETEPNQDTPICVYLANRNPKSVQVKLNFVDGTITNDAQKNKACKNEDQQENFWQYVDLWTWDDAIFTLSGMSVLEKKFILRYPDWYAGKIYGCATLSLVEEKIDASDSMFMVLNRLGYPIEVFIKWDLVSDLHYQDNFNSHLPKNTMYNQWKFLVSRSSIWNPIVQFTLINSGNILQEATYTITLNSFSHHNTVITGSASVLPEESKNIYEHILFPWWDIPLKVKIDVSYLPVFDFESDAITDQMRVVKSLATLKNTSAIFFISDSMRYIVIGIGGVCILWCILIILVRKYKYRKKKLS